MTDTHPSRPLRPVIAVMVLAVASLVSGAALAEDSSPSTQKSALPGVTGDYRIAKPAPEPDDALPAGENGTFKIGDTDVRISGSITVDVGAGSIGPPRH
ncbi:hypothetical protein EN962_28025 [Mesorhizobium sp. M7A.F.Ca.CA.001.09.2.1]|uniref:Uncharacterized protein n=1 Tax=Mesorhizobium ciceri TaxID=39645 RepID=A0AB38T6U5_9HYPH|nr:MULTISPECIES: hypothetical protein [Mesorhizobium]RUY55268.1 hypothetical protein EN981_07070 [Mesorhizobium sp. M7A.F.Ca.CA.001.13.2.1]MBZ9717667.1 hypothetical protein [Mesorhizobium sp. AD1-1]MDF3216353.1 hypothetical protein [Mesorhizobium ciceri]RUY58094.1 hypothetical protein EN965_33285 [Mesorhizobium sp. M7A.F.Ca.CA.001.05.1.1]RUY63446.1 hypothetical protein EN980_27985 [Mesorhizobium sp. M7A.F.Ca.CA.001.13.1.1]